MKYRTVPVYPQVGDKINKAIERIATKQQAAPEAMKQAQAEAIADLRRPGSRSDSGPRVAVARLAARRERHRRASQRKIAQQHRFFAFCVAPSLAVLAVITLLPALYLLATSFTPLNLTRPETLWDFSQPLRQLPPAAGPTIALHNSIWVQIKLSFWTVLLQLLIGLGLALLLNMRVAPARGAAHGVPDPDGAAADRRRDHLEGDLHARHQPDARRLPRARLERAGADHRPQLGADLDHHRRHLGMVPLHHADGAGGAADDAAGAARRRQGRRRLAVAAHCAMSPCPSSRACCWSPACSA